MSLVRLHSSISSRLWVASFSFISIYKEKLCHLHYWIWFRLRMCYFIFFIIEMFSEMLLFHQWTFDLLILKIYYSLSPYFSEYRYLFRLDFTILMSSQFFIHTKQFVSQGGKSTTNIWDIVDVLSSTVRLWNATVWLVALVGSRTWSIIENCTQRNWVHRIINKRVRNSWTEKM